MYVAELTYVCKVGSQEKSLTLMGWGIKTKTLKSTIVANIAYDLVGKICQGTTLTCKTVIKILQGIRSEVFAMFKRNPEDFILKAVRLINEQKVTMILDEITYNVTGEERI